MTMDADLCVIGGGEAGITSAMAGAALGLRVVLIDAATAEPCWHYWDVVLASLNHATRVGNRHDGGRPGADLAQFRDDLRSALTRAAPDRRLARLTAANIRILQGQASFRDPDTVGVHGHLVRARRYVLATGTMAADPADVLLDRLLGADPIPAVPLSAARPRHVALAQGLRRLGCPVDLTGPLLPDCDAELVASLHRRLRADGLDPGFATDPSEADPTINAVPDLGLARAGIALQGGNLALSPALRTTNRRVYAVGSSAGARSSGETRAQVAVVLKAAFFRLPIRHDAARFPVCVLTDPAIAAVGLSESAARAKSRISVWRWPYAETASGSIEPGQSGFVKVIADGRDRVVGAGIVHPDAAELIAFWSLALQSGQRVSRLADVPLAAPAFAEASSRLATSAAMRRLQNPWLKRALTFLNRLP